jgi:TRAP transporter TAXI family solute receptor
VIALVASCGPWGADAGPTTAIPLTIASGGSQGVYYQYAQALADQLRHRDAALDVTVAETTGSIANLLMLDEGAATCAFTAGDAAAEAVQGSAPFHHPLRVAALARVYDDYLHLVTRRGSGINSVPDLRSRRVSVGPTESGTRLMVDRLFAAAGIDAAEIHTSDLGINESVAALRSGTVDAFFWSGGVPTSGVASLSEHVPLQLISLAPYVPRLRSRYDAVYRLAAVPAGTYGIGQSVSTIAVPNEFVCSSDTPDAVVSMIVATLFGSRQQMAARVPQALALDRRPAIETGPVPLHPAAAKWFQQTKP